MLKIWAKTLVGDKIQKDYMLVKEDRFDFDLFMAYLIEICHEMDIPTPLVLKPHKFNFKKFNIVRFKVEDFVESIDFDCLTLENASE